MRLNYDTTLRTLTARHDDRCGEQHWYRSLPLARVQELRAPSIFVPMFASFAAGFISCLGLVVLALTP